MKKLIQFLTLILASVATFFGFNKNHNSAYSSLTSGYAMDEYSDYIGIVRRISEMSTAPVDQFSYSLTNTTGKNLTIALTRPAMIDVARVAIPDASGNITANGGGLVAVTGTAPRILYDDVTKIASVRTVDAVVGDGIVDSSANQVLYKNVTGELLIAPDNLPVSFFLNQMNDDRFIVDSIDVNVNDASVYTGASIVIKDANSFDSQAEKTIKLKDFQNLESLQDKRITIDTVKKYGFLVQLDRKSLVSLYMPGLVNGVANTFMSIQFNIKKVDDDAQASINAAVKEYISLERTGVPSTKFQQVIASKEIANPTNEKLLEAVVEKKITEYASRMAK